VYGAAWDDRAPDGPWLWLFDQSGTAEQTTLYQFDPTNYTMTGFSYELPWLYTAGRLAGGLAFTEEWDPAYCVLCCIVQGTPEDELLCLEMYNRSTQGDGFSQIPQVNDKATDCHSTGEQVEDSASPSAVSICPNPFNPSTVAGYELRVASYVNLSVYDVAGRNIAELVNGWQDAGYHKVVFAAGDLPSGVYIYYLTAGEFSANGQMLLLK
jgi:hypothetical protein